MAKILNDDLIYLVLSIVEEIPKGNVATYGQIAYLAGKPKNSRLIGKNIMKDISKIVKKRIYQYLMKQ